ncbi:hypothetical protein HY988_02730 [Candidatus Micrarchaeota archaeon]|nr:hypothetical protein [Candidatus Micrarchaeota archaeon]
MGRRIRAGILAVSITAAIAATFFLKKPHPEGPMEIKEAHSSVPRSSSIPSLSEVQKIQAKMKSKIPITPKEADMYVRERYIDAFAAHVSPMQRNPLVKDKKRIVARVEICSDARTKVGNVQSSSVGTIVFDSHAGNLYRNSPERDARQYIFVGHGGYKGCGAVGAAKELKSNGEEPEDLAIKAITRVAPAVFNEKVEDHSKRSVMAEAKRAEKDGKIGSGIYVNFETGAIELVYGPRTDENARVMKLIKENFPNPRDAPALKTQYASFITFVQSGRSLTGKTILNSGPNVTFEANFTVDEKGEVTLHPAAVGSVEYALLHVPGAKDSNIIVVIDPDENIARAAAMDIKSAISKSKIPELKEIIQRITVLAYQEDWFNGRLKALNISN